MEPVVSSPGLRFSWMSLQSRELVQRLPFAPLKFGPQDVEEAALTQTN